MAAITIKYHQCGKRNCTCVTQGKLHGPFLWLISDDHTVKDRKNGRKDSKYLGKTADTAYLRLQRHIPYSLTKISSFSLKKGLEERIEETQESIQIFPQRHLSREIMQIETEYL
ncbi:MAG: hypothetical protein ACFFDT_18325 [Candidatus Hodarchaeota archaeon]